MRKGLKLNRRAFAVLAPLALAACAGQTMQGTSGAKNADVARVENYFRTVDLENAPFLQTWPNGSRGGGLITYKPGSLYMHYTAPHEMELRASGHHAVFTDAQQASQTRIGLAHNPLGLLLDNPVVLSGAVTVTNVQKQPGVLQLSLTRTDNPSQGLVTLVFHDVANRLALSSIQIVDERRHVISISLDPV